MKIINWRKKVAASLVAAGLWVPSSALATNIPLGDPGFEDAPVGADGYAYADEYASSTAWVYNPDDVKPGATTANETNWLYDAGYAEAHGRPAPFGNQAMHGRKKYNGQEVSETFQAGMTYSFSVWAQIDDTEDPAPAGGNESEIYLYIYNGDVAFTEASSLVAEEFSKHTFDFVPRDPSWNQAQSLAAWQQITTHWTVAPGAPEIGHPIGVAFRVGPPSAIDNATLTVRPVPEPTTLMLVGMGGLLLLPTRRRK